MSVAVGLHGKLIFPSALKIFIIIFFIFVGTMEHSLESAVHTNHHPSAVSPRIDSLQHEHILHMPWQHLHLQLDVGAGLCPTPETC